MVMPMNQGYNATVGAVNPAPVLRGLGAGAGARSQWQGPGDGGALERRRGGSPVTCGGKGSELQFTI